MTNYSEKRKCLKLKFRSTTEQGKLSSLVLLCMENDITVKLTIHENVFTNFTEEKIRRMLSKI